MSVERSQLANGLTVVSHAMPEVETVSLGIWIGAGSRSEGQAEHGVAHFLEHMAFKGTARRSARDIAEEIEAVGGDLNAATSVDATAYYARVMRKDMPLALDILSDIILAPIFDHNELARERDVILQEIAASQDSPDDIVFDLVSEAAFPDQPVGRPILGTAQSVSGFDRAHLGAYLAAHYHAPNMVLAAAGAVDHAALVAEAERRLAGLIATTTPQPESAAYSGGFRRSAKPFEQTHLVLAFQAPHYRHPDYFAAQILAGALGGGMSSRLFQEVRERRGLCYSVYAFSTGLSDTGMFAIHAAGAPDRAHDLFAVIRVELERAAEGGFDAKELARVKAQLKMGLLAGLESSAMRAEQLARQILVHGRVLTTEELIDKVETVEAADLQSLVECLLVSPLSLATVGPILHVARFEAVAEKFTVPASKAA
ncbi:MAG: M16 family metallopeptidase [Methyloceanibacter sp.]|uniref:M16 family metallopeptidase n=1 Tax=Methyloceanibacter sp. TaxID=1965321 RepID=UPI003D6D4396